MDETANCTIEHVQVESAFLSGVKGHAALIQHLGAKGRKIFLWLWGKSNLYSEFQESQKYVERSCLKNKTTNNKQARMNESSFSTILGTNM